MFQKKLIVRIKDASDGRMVIFGNEDKNGW